MIKIAIFGDSITAGWNGQVATNILKRELEMALKNQYKLEAEVILFGVPGDDTNDAVKRLSAVKMANADYNVVFFGANDASAHHEVSTADFKANLELIVAELAGQIIMVTPPAVNEQRLDVRDRNNHNVEAYKEITLAVSNQHLLPTIDIYHQMKVYPGTNEFLQKDGLHFTQEGYQLLAFLIAAKVKSLRS
ncbi:MULTISPECIES: GDSL-type esterase/lipase family protein [unclassified Enterococcus]|uniref:GDSL-type esterase/lipase family protein n=1 Tax=unclassified Enterococcus TaxID=2608891 RepID=UPI00155549DE|nr:MULTISPECIES: GDSL-type esterase/lipase family protein [unclassified Enterococcus]MBS7576137.1 esterase [Enterococcus sp. MMGLQ5-2]MBS7583370.1 esterase [Enterococcus sp. MMGLQ5-1]NPD11230.1 esterase [Enterococcus sp. MMGLQ5-1]NPD35973.1 esterase [Enterococcus sp. MMGLQ5-2]